jgi:2-dehydro-3-deoxygluconokinase
MMSPNQALDVITIGEAMVLFVAQQAGSLDEVRTFERATAGAELNVAIGLTRLGLRVGYLSRLGEDLFGRHITAVLAREGIDHRQVTMDPVHPTGFMLKSRSDDGSDPQIQYFRTGSAASRMQADELPRTYCANARHLHLTGIFAALTPTTRELVFELARRSRAAGLSISFDPNLRPTLWRSKDDMVACLNQLATLSDWVLPGLDEGRLLTGRDSLQGIADFYLERGAKAVVVKLGPEGAFFSTPRACGHIPGIPVARVVDTVGAGDGFAVGVISGLLEGLPLSAATARGNAIGSRVVTFPGDADGLPTRAELDLLMTRCQAIK